MTKQAGLFSIGEVARQLGVPRWRLAYLIERGALSGPTHEVPGRRLFSDEGINRLREELRQLAETQVASLANERAGG